MNCQSVKDKSGLLVDAELPVAEREAVERHLVHCDACRKELRAVKEIALILASPPDAVLPDTLWPAIEQRLDEPARHSFALRSRWPLAAAVALAVGAGLFAVVSRGSRLEASSLDFRLLLDEVQIDAQAAFTRFLDRHGAEKVSASQARRDGANLSLGLPDVLPGDFRLQSVYRFRIAGQAGFAAIYDREGEFLGAVFHPLVKEEEFGTYKDQPCTVGQYRGHKVQAGEWALIHVTGRPRCGCAGVCHCTPTCHCVLSRLKEDAELLDVLAAVAPKPAPSSDPAP
jgi:hypothetical protein